MFYLLIYEVGTFVDEGQSAASELILTDVEGLGLSISGDNDEMAESFLYVDDLWLYVFNEKVTDQVLYSHKVRVVFENIALENYAGSFIREDLAS